MSRDIKEIFEDLDKHAAEFNFPVFDNAYVEFAAARLTAFRGANDWLIVFEILGFSTREIEFVNDIYAYGSCVFPEGFVGEEIPISSSLKEPLFDAETNECVADWSHWTVQLGTQEISFTPSRSEYVQTGIYIDRDAGARSLREIELLRFLVSRIGEERLLLSDEALLGHFAGCRNTEKFLQTTQWQHPDIANSDKPSQNISIRSLVEALYQNNRLLFQQGNPNTHWSFWVDRDT
jgi:hypothetical protein